MKRNGVKTRKVRILEIVCATYAARSSLDEVVSSRKDGIPGGIKDSMSAGEVIGK